MDHHDLSSASSGNTLPFTKLVACGNDFVALDNRTNRITGTERGFIQRICDRRFGVGADGLLLVESSNQASTETPKAHFHMRIFNPDGSEASMCGNGARACALFAKLLGFNDNPLHFSTLAGLQTVWAKGYTSRIRLAPPTHRFRHMNALQEEPELLHPADDLHCRGDIFVGVPHLIVEVLGDLNDLDIASIAPSLRYHSLFAPEGVNVMFVKRFTDGLQLRAWEKGVEGETWGCGTGAVASCLLLDEVEALDWPVTVKMKGGEMLVDTEEDSPAFSGEVRVCHTGFFPLQKEDKLSRL